MNLSEIRRWLKERDIHLTKSLGQNFLHDPQQLERIVQAAELTRDDKVLEIGPGLGPLTEHLLHHVGEVLAIEKDRRLVQVLQERFRTPPVPRLIHDDALEWLKREPSDLSDWKVVSNLPYSVASPILVELCRGVHSPKRLVVTLQFEVVQRLMAQAGNKEYGVLTLLVQLDFEPQAHFKIARGCFFPEPDVDSACIVLRRRTAPLLEDELRRLFVRVVKRAFSQRRKMMKNLLRAEWPADRVERAMKSVGLHPQVRAEAVSLAQFVALTRDLVAQPGSGGVLACISHPEIKSSTVCRTAIGPSVAALSVGGGAAGRDVPRSNEKCSLADRQPVGAASPAGTSAIPVNPGEEIFDVVNERDEVIGAAPRAEVHARGLLHRAVHVLVFNAQGEVFLQKRSMTKDKSPGLWDSSASGHLDRGEAYEACAVRELWEEIGLHVVAPPERLFKLAACEETDQEHVWVYRCEAEGPFALNPAELAGGEWVAPGEVTRRIATHPQDYASAFRALWRRYTAPASISSASA